MLATQATVSRDLEDLGAVKVRIPGGTMAYAVPEHSKDAVAAPTTTSAGSWASSSSTWRTPANLVVLRTPPGLRARGRPPRSTGPGIPDVLGTVAGDDTLSSSARRRCGGGIAVAGPPGRRSPDSEAEEKRIDR